MLTPSHSSVRLCTHTQHQDSAYITTYPDTLIGSWLALDRADESNGCLLVARGSHIEPVYAEKFDDGTVRGNIVHAQGVFEDLPAVEHTSHLDDSLNTLSAVAKKYGAPVPVVVEPGDVVYFHSHLVRACLFNWPLRACVLARANSLLLPSKLRLSLRAACMQLHRSHVNAGGATGRQSRRAFVAHYCNARSFVPWNGGSVHRPFEGAGANGEHILARGSTHLPYAQPRFGTHCAATELGVSTAPRL
eukprot:SAG22_NODE_6663_length_825_cov_1.705234_1_plen_247_part_00